jgi:hypothetical protein
MPETKPNNANNELKSVKIEAFLKEYQELVNKHGFALNPVLQVVDMPKIKEQVIDVKPKSNPNK